MKFLTAQRRDATGVDILRGQSLSAHRATADASTLTTKAELIEVLREIFGFDVDAIGADALDALWTRGPPAPTWRGRPPGRP